MSSAWRHRQRFWLIIAVLSTVLLLSISLSVTLGAVDIPASLVWQIACKEGLELVGVTTDENPWSEAQYNIAWLIRFPRVLLALLVGAGLAVVGVVMQALVRNPLADPYLLGVSSGASIGAVSVLAFGLFRFAGIYALSIGAFLGSFLSFISVFLVAQQGGKLLPGRLLLAGIAVSFFFSGLTSLVTLTSDQRELAKALLTWILGSLAGTDWIDLALPAIVLILCSIYLLLQARSLNALLTGEESAISLGVNTKALRQQLFWVVSLLTGCLVAVSGAIGFIGLMLPHFVRLLVGSDHRLVLPVSLLAGGIFLIWVDVVARVAFAPVELPVGVITSLLGAPFFLWLMRRRGGHIL
jgi:iron complex transport system permease protein